eukprot:Blabericola_migrator_1__3700@NODE_2106_length_3266_cov_113_884026_g1334_i0_p4_GENE_NODE_2106_length_3266_cov_113_884026_g1334_i0NODE_2106_length_3266_cov_113_884026_g1334_i0_p4_ORF_typecomplete_len126_score5_87DUF702/PF05142_12/0_00058_NODE_2106_length_3266_cov_113_884026_g1334_i021522529
MRTTLMDFTIIQPNQLSFRTSSEVIIMSIGGATGSLPDVTGSTANSAPTSSTYIHINKMGITHRTRPPNITSSSGVARRSCRLSRCRRCCRDTQGRNMEFLHIVDTWVDANAISSHHLLAYNNLS